MSGYTHTQSLGHQTGLASRLFNKLLTRRFREAGIEMTAEQWGVIQVLINGGAMSQGQLGEMLYLEKSTISRSVSGLEKRGWVAWQKSAEDARQKLIVLTPNAENVARQCYDIARGVLRDAQAGLDPEALTLSQLQLADVINNLRTLNQS
ncbi:MarR family winged helix-turn-helix transcriptional regulator [Pseudomaricurvus sp. HS19]|uniref:MarR family winged helix-turn-helix transcriptional regulator n=1 Tax=Pseudomaricurvus sp. HS19 TaxID=2692626 RepID=UPI00136A9197|nr:MarR family transcriptional regulator [Pseudomaricurvus sp. HS19]MYM63418.1 MarR family transcriptional regulator [Pseudomaricurvus sp. HS19]